VHFFNLTATTATPDSVGKDAVPRPCPGHPMSRKHNADRRHHIPKMSFKVQNWPEYEAGLRRRGSLALWIEDTALKCWQTCGPGGQPRYSDAAVQASLMLSTALKLSSRQTEGLLASVLTLMKLTISAPDYTSSAVARPSCR
jgi:Transposase DDE domain